MSIKKISDFYAYYNAVKIYVAPIIKKKQIRWYDTEYWKPMHASVDKSVLELGCGTGEFLSYLQTKGVKRYLGIDRDVDALAVLPDSIRANTRIADIWDFLNSNNDIDPFDHIVLLDVLEHFSYVDGARLLEKLHEFLKKNGSILIRVPNMASPWGGMNQYADLTHISSYGPNNLGQLAVATGFKATQFLPQTRGPKLRQVTQAMLHSIIGRMLVTAPEVWTSNIIAIFKRD